MSDLAQIVKAYDVRGTVPDQLNEEVTRAVGAAFVQTLRAGGEDVSTIVIAHDMRESSPGLTAGFSAGARAEGADVVEAGLASTDMLYFASGSGKSGRFFSRFSGPRCSCTSRTRESRSSRITRESSRSIISRASFRECGGLSSFSHIFSGRRSISSCDSVKRTLEPLET